MGRTSKAVAAAVFLCAPGAMPAANAEDLLVFDWSGYEDPAFHPAYAEEHGEQPSFAYFGDEDEAFQKLRTGFKADIAHPCSQSILKWRDAGLVAELDPSRIDAWDDILPGIRSMKNLMTTDDGKAWMMPFEWGNTAVIYRTDKLKPADVQSLRAFADPRFEGRISMPDNVDDAFALAMLAQGETDWTGMTDEQFAEAAGFLREVHKNVRLYWTDNTQLSQAFAGNEIDLTWGWNETATTLQADGVPVEMKKDTDEGVSTWVCGYVLLNDRPGKLDNAYDFLNAVLEPRVAEYLVADWGYGHANGAAMRAMDPATVAAAGYSDVASLIDKTLFQTPVSAELKQRMIREYENIKAGF